MKDLNVYYNGKPLYSLNPLMIDKLKVPDDKVELLKQLHVHLHEVFDKINETPLTDKKRLKRLADEITSTENKMQVAWGYPMNKKGHTWWYLAPKCLCPRLDNAKLQGKGDPIYSKTCPLHKHMIDKD